MKFSSSRLLLAISIASGLAAVGGVLFIYFGIYNVSALAQHTKPVYVVLQSALDRSIAVRSDQIQVPDLRQFDRIQGVRLYARHCQQCHGAPGVAPDEFSLGMLPAPTAAAKLARHRSAAEIFWSVKNGIKMTGMPAWNYRLGDQEIWAIVALVNELAHFTADQYLALRRQSLSDPALTGNLADTMETETPAVLEDSSVVERGRLALQQYNCSSCHVIPGVIAARNKVGPPLGTMAERSFIAGVLKNTDHNLIRWIRFPQEVDPDTTMPDLDVSETHARQMVAYLRSLAELEQELKHPPPGERPRS